MSPRVNELAGPIKLRVQDLYETLAATQFRAHKPNESCKYKRTLANFHLSWRHIFAQNTNVWQKYATEYIRSGTQFVPTPAIYVYCLLTLICKRVSFLYRTTEQTGSFVNGVPSFVSI